MYPPIPQNHPWLAAEQARLHALDLWQQNRLPESQAAFAAAIKEFPEFPFLYSSFHLFLHKTSPPSGPPPQAIVEIAANDYFRSFSMYRFFERDQTSRKIRDGGWESFEPPAPTALARWLKRKSISTFVDVGANSGFYSLLAA